MANSDWSFTYRYVPKKPLFKVVTVDEVDTYTRIIGFTDGQREVGLVRVTRWKVPGDTDILDIIRPNAIRL